MPQDNPFMSKNFLFCSIDETEGQQLKNFPLLNLIKQMFEEKFFLFDQVLEFALKSDIIMYCLLYKDHNFKAHQTGLW